MKHPLFVLFIASLAVAVGALGLLTDRERALLLGFDIAAAIFILGSLVSLGGASPEQLRGTAANNDAGRSLLLLVSAIVGLVILIVVGLELDQVGRSEPIEVMLVVGTLSLAWLFTNLVYAVHYGHLFYDPAADGGDHGGLAFPGAELPDFRDFCYFAFVLGMTFQVSDVQVTSRRIRRTATLHGILAFAFNIGVLALTVNLVAGAT